MIRLNLDFIINTSIESIFSNLQAIFEKILQEFKSYLKFDLIYSNIKIIISENDHNNYALEKDFFKIGVIKAQKNNSLTIYISSSYKKFIRVILLREAYKCFIPLQLQENEIVNIFINQKVENDLQKSEYIEDWKEFKRKSVVSYEFMEAEFDRLEKFLKQTSTENRPSPFQFFFSYIRRNVELLKDTREEFFYLDKKSFYDKLFEDYTRRYTNYPNETLETIRIIAELFYKIKNYRSLLDYQNHFKEFKEFGLIKTNLSLRKFTENMQWIKSNTNIAPNYSMNWFELDLISILCIMKFHPLIKTKEILKIIKQIPFFIWPNFSKNNFGVEVMGYFLLPKTYLNDLTNFLKKLELDGLVIKLGIYIINKAANLLNLNCARGSTIILNPNKTYYKKEYELEVNTDFSYGKSKLKLSLLDWLLIDRIRQVSITGLGFERKLETLRALKSDLLNEIQSQSKLINNLKENLNKIQNSPVLRNRVLTLIDNNKSYGFFYIKQMLFEHLTLAEMINNVLVENYSINNYFEFQEFNSRYGLFKTIQDNILLNKFGKKLIKTLYFKSKKKFKKNLEEYHYFYNLFKSFYDLKLFNLESIKSVILDKTLIQKIYQSKEKKLKEIYENYKISKISYQLIERRLEDFLYNDPPIIQPNLLNTIMIIARLTNYYPMFILKDTSQTREIIEKIKYLFPRVYIIEILEYTTQDKFIYLRLLMPNLRLKEKQILYSIFYNQFKENLIMSKSFLYSGFSEAFSRKDFYDLEREDFFYTKDLFDRFYPYVRKILRTEVKPLSESKSNPQENLWGSERNFSYLINEVETRISKEHIDLKFSNLDKLLDFHKNLHKILFHIENFKYSKTEYFFKNCIKSVKIIPSFQSFGFGQYFLYFYSTDLNQIDFKHFLHNSFQKVKFQASIDNSNSFLINFIWPYRNPNNSLLNWLTKSKKAIREYCLFYIKKLYQIFHFNYNLSVNEWDLNPNRFKIYFQNILFNPEYKLTIPDLKEFNIGDLNISEYFTPDSSEFKALTDLYNCKSIDIKSYLGTRNYTIINQIIELLEKMLVFPFISVKNLDLKEKIYLILPNVKKEHIETILKIFSFFNIGYIYEIEGEYYIYGFTEEKSFENGLLIKLYLPDCQLDEFFLLFDSIFEYFEIKHYIILNDLVDGKYLLTSIYKNLDFLKSYNPLKNLIWNKKDKKWMNHKLFTDKFEKRYPPL